MVIEWRIKTDDMKRSISRFEIIDSHISADREKTSYKIENLERKLDTSIMTLDQAFENKLSDHKESIVTQFEGRIIAIEDVTTHKVPGKNL